MWSREDLAWVAGIYEGEGSCCAIAQTVNSVKLQLSIKMTDLDVLQTVAEKARLGRVYGPYAPSKTHWKPYYCYVANGNEAYALAVALFGYLHGRRREQVGQAINAYIQSFRDRPTAQDRFWRHVVRLDNGCWIWSGAKTSRIGPDDRRYGQFAVTHKQFTQAHSYLFRLDNPGFGKNRKLSPSCSTSLCIRHWGPKNG